MAIRPKTKRRVPILIGGFLLVAALIVGLSMLRQRQIRHQLNLQRVAGMAAFKRGDWPTVITQLSSYVKRQSNDPDVLRALALAEIYDPNPTQDRAHDAAERLSNYLLMKPDDREALHLLLKLQKQQSNWDEVIKVAANILKLDPHDPDALKYLAIGRSNNGKYAEALAPAMQYNDANPTDLEGHDQTYRIMASLAMPARKFLDRAQTFEKQYPQDVRFKLAEVIAYARSQNPTQATIADRTQSQAELNLLLSITGPTVTPPDATFVKMAVIYLDRTNNYTRSQDLLARSTPLLSDPEIKLLYVQRLWQNKQNGEVVKQLADVTPESNSATPFMAYKAMALSDLDRKPEADALVKALGKRENDPAASAWALGLEALFHPEASGVRQRFDAMERAVVADPQNGVLRYMLATQYASVGETERAIDESTAAMQSLPSWAAPHLQLARMFNKRGDYNIAANQTRIAISATGDKPDPNAYDIDPLVEKLLIQENLAQAHRDPGEMTQALTAIASLRKDNPDEPFTLPPYVRLLAQTGKSEQARSVINAEIANPNQKGGQQTLIELALLSQQLKLGMEDQLLDAAEQKFQLTPQLAAVRARQLSIKPGKSAADGLKYLLDAAAQSKTDRSSWDTAVAYFRETSNDPDRKQTWTALGNNYQDVIAVQTMILNRDVAASAWDDLGFIQQTIDRLHALTGNEALGWKLGRARMLLARNGKNDANDAVATLTDILKHPAAASRSEPHVLQSQAYEKLGAMDQAISEMARASSTSQINISVVYQLLRLYHTAGRFSEAVDTFDRLTDAAGLPPTMAQNAAAMMVRQHESNRALSLLQRYYDVNNPTTQSTGLIGLLALVNEQQGKVMDAARLYQSVLDANDLRPEVVQSASRFFANWGQIDTARKFLAKLDTLALKPGEKELTLADFEDQFGKDQARTDQLYRQAVAADQANVTPVAHYIAFLIRQNKLPEASTTVDSALQTWKGNRDLTSLKALAVNLNGSPIAAQLAPVAATMSQDASNPALAATIGGLLDMQKLPNRDQNQRFADLVKKFPRYYPLYELAVRKMVAEPEDSAKLMAMNLGNQAMQNLPDQPAAARLACTAAANIGQWREAQAAAMRWLDRSAQRPIEPDWFIAQCQLMQHQPAEAISRLEGYLVDAKAQPEIDLNAKIVTTYAAAQVLAGNSDAAAALLTPLATASDTWRMKWLGLAGEMFQDPVKASAWIQKVQPLIPAGSLVESHHLADAWYDVATRMDYQPGFVNCAAILKPFADQGQLDETSLLTLASALGAVNDAGAADAYRKAIAADIGQQAVETADAQNNLAEILLARGDAPSLQEAADMASKAVASPNVSAGNKPYFLDTLARVYLKQGKPELAAEQFHKADDMLKNNPLILIGWADALVQSKRNDRALAKLQEVELRLTPGTRLTQELQAELESVREALHKTRSAVTATEQTPAGR